MSSLVVGATVRAERSVALATVVQLGLLRGEAREAQLAINWYTVVADRETPTASALLAPPW